MTTNKISRVIYLFAAIFLIAFIFAIVDTYPWKDISAYDLGRMTALFTKNLVKIISVVALVILVVRYYKK